MVTDNKIPVLPTIAPEMFEKMLGSWIHDVQRLSELYATSKPFPNVIIDNFWSEEFVTKMVDSFQDPRTGDRKGWVCYNNPLEKKLANNDFSSFPDPIKEAFALLQNDRFVDLMQKITAIDSLEADPHLHGAGMHASPTDGKLDVHLDYSIHPMSQMERRVNLINYLSKDWDASWGGSLELYDHDENNNMAALAQTVHPVFNRACLFRTSDISYHGFPDPIRAPKEALRKSIAVYYVSPPREGASHRYKARFYKRPTDPEHAGLEALREIRVTRWITPDDMAQHVPEWNEALEW